MNTQTSLLNMISDCHLLKHPFYQAWTRGELSREQLRHYAIQYFPHVRGFPRFVSAVHSQCESDEARKSIFLNLAEEEGIGGDPHPELWLRFAEALGATRKQVSDATFGTRAQALADTYHQLCRSSYAEGLGALIAYESQSAEIAITKLEGLARFYGITDESSTAFFSVHGKADRLHTDVCLKLVDALPEVEREHALSAARVAAQALWDFLTEVYEDQKRCA